MQSQRDCLALLCRRAPLRRHSQRDANVRGLLSRRAFGTLKSFCYLCERLLASHALKQPKVVLRPRSPCGSLLGPCRRLRHVWFLSMDRRYILPVGSNVRPSNFQAARRTTQDDRAKPSYVRRANRKTMPRRTRAVSRAPGREQCGGARPSSPFETPDHAGPSGRR
jgi:hypothetical protein